MQLTSRPPLTADRARELLRYEPDTGLVFWRVTTAAKSRAGQRAGCLRADKSRVIGIDRRVYQEHRLIVLIMTGEWPPEEVDHIDGDPSNNRYDNLRLCPHDKNMKNRKAERGRSLPKGVYRTSYPSRRPYIAEIMSDGKKFRLGKFLTPEEAHAAYCNAANDLHGEFARVA